MLVRFTIASIKRTKHEYKYADFSISNGFSKEKTGIEYVVELTAENGDRFFMFHQRKTDATMRQYRVMYVDATHMVSDEYSKYSPEHEGAYKVRRTYTKEDFLENVGLQKVNLAKRQKTDAAELERLAAYI